MLQDLQEDLNKCLNDTVKAQTDKVNGIMKALQDKKIEIESQSKTQTELKMEIKSLGG